MFLGYDENEKKGRCDGCKYQRRAYAGDQFSFYGCYHKPYHGKWVAEIKDCPIEGGEQDEQEISGV